MKEPRAEAPLPPRLRDTFKSFLRPFAAMCEAEPIDVPNELEPPLAELIELSALPVFTPAEARLPRPLMVIARLSLISGAFLSELMKSTTAVVSTFRLEAVLAVLSPAVASLARDDTN
jgi:hypothetical protein